MTGCTDCFKEIGTINEKINESDKNAQQLANKEKKNVAVFPDFTFAIFEEAAPPGTIKVIVPVFGGEDVAI